MSLYGRRICMWHNSSNSLLCIQVPLIIKNIHPCVVTQEALQILFLTLSIMVNSAVNSIILRRPNFHSCFTNKQINIFICDVLYLYNCVVLRNSLITKKNTGKEIENSLWGWSESSQTLANLSWFYSCVIKQ